MTEEAKNKKNKKKIPKIMVVDDSTVMRLIIRNLLEEEGYQVIEATNGREAFITYKKYRPDLVLMDISMPEVDGIHATKKIIDIDDEALIIIVSAMRQKAHVIEAITKGASDYVIKPINVERLLESIHKMIPPPIKIHKKKEDAKEPSVVKILLVEDRPMNQKMTKTLLEKKGYEVSIVANGKEALKILEETDFSLILMDIEMPELDGYETTKQIREGEKERNKTLPIIAMTAYDEEEYLAKALEVGMNEHITKPIDAEKLYTIIESFLEKEKKEEEVKEKREPPLDIKKIKEDLGEDEKIIKEMVEVFLEESKEVLINLKEAIKKNDTQYIVKIAHGLKGELGSLRAKGAFILVSRLKEVATQENLQGLQELHGELTKKIQEIRDFTKEEGWLKG